MSGSLLDRRAEIFSGSDSSGSKPRVLFSRHVVYILLKVWTESQTGRVEAV